MKKNCLKHKWVTSGFKYKELKRVCSKCEKEQIGVHCGRWIGWMWTNKTEWDIIDPDIPLTFEICEKKGLGNWFLLVKNHSE